MVHAAPAANTSEESSAGAGPQSLRAFVPAAAGIHASNTACAATLKGEKYEQQLQADRSVG